MFSGRRNCHCRTRGEYSMRGEGLRREERLHRGVEPILHKAEGDEHAEPLHADGNQQQQHDGNAAEDAGAALYQPCASAGPVSSARKGSVGTMKRGPQL